MKTAMTALFKKQFSLPDLFLLCWSAMSAVDGHYGIAAVIFLVMTAINIVVDIKKLNEVKHEQSNKRPDFF